jgi:cytochrome c oxidase subunit 4
MTEEKGARPHDEESVSARALFFTWLVLMVLAGTSLALRFAHLGDLGAGVALGIALVKAVLVGLVFMELLFEKPSVRLAFAAGLVMVSILIGLMVADVVTRAPPPLAPPGTAARARG